MKSENQDKLLELFPDLYAQLAWGFECGDGWFELLKELSHRLTEVIKKEFPDEDFRMCASQVKEKYGTLRFYMTCSTAEMDRIIDEAEAKSAITCEICGKPGKINSGPWYEVRCEECK